MKKIKISSEVAYLIGVLLLAFAVAMITAADFGVSMIVAPALILSLKLDGILSFGVCEYIIQGILFIAMCIAAKKIKPIYFFSFFTTIFYGAALDLFRLIPFFNPNVYPPESYNLSVRIIFFIVAELLTGLALAFAFKTYLYPQTNDFFVKCLSFKFNVNLTKFKLIYDYSFLFVAVLMTLILFGRFEGIGIGTIVLTIVNGPLIGFFTKFVNKCFEVTPRFKKIEKMFEM